MSGSLDTNVKVWDVRQKTCCFTYKGHVKSVCKVEFSPDDKMVATGGEDGTVKVGGKFVAAVLLLCVPCTTNHANGRECPATRKAVLTLTNC